MSNLAKLQPYQKQGTLRGSPTETAYFKWLREPLVGQCCLTGSPYFDLAHTAHGVAQGKGMGRKGPLDSVLPLKRPLHAIEESKGAEFWAAVGLPDHLAWAERLFEHFEQRLDPTEIFQDMQELSSRSVVRELLTTGWPKEATQ